MCEKKNTRPKELFFRQIHLQIAFDTIKRNGFESTLKSFMGAAFAVFGAWSGYDYFKHTQTVLSPADLDRMRSETNSKIIKGKPNEQS